MENKCRDCMEGDHEDYGPVQKVVVKDPETGRIVRRGWVCAEHIDTYMEDGYTVTKDAN